MYMFQLALLIAAAIIFIFSIITHIVIGVEQNNEERKLNKDSFEMRHTKTFLISRTGIAVSLLLLAILATMADYLEIQSADVYIVFILATIYAILYVIDCYSWRCTASDEKIHMKSLFRKENYFEFHDIMSVWATYQLKLTSFHGIVLLRRKGKQLFISNMQLDIICFWSD